MSLRELQQLMDGKGNEPSARPGNRRTSQRAPRLDPSDDPGLAAAIRASTAEMREALRREQKEAESQGFLSPSGRRALPVTVSVSTAAPSVVLPGSDPVARSAPAVPTDSFGQPLFTPVLPAAPSLVTAPAPATTTITASSTPQATVTAGEFAQLVSAVAALSAAVSGSRSSSRSVPQSAPDRLAALSGFTRVNPVAEVGADDGDGSSTDSDGDDDGTAAAASALGSATAVPTRASKDIVAQAIAGVSEYGSFVHWVRQQDFNKIRNLKEAVSLARIIDLLLKGSRFRQQALDLAVRRLAGVHLADQCNSNWALSEAIEQRSAKDSFLDQSTVNGMFKLAERLDKVQRQAARDPPSGSYNSGRRAQPQRSFPTANPQQGDGHASVPGDRSRGPVGFSVNRFVGQQTPRPAQAPAGAGLGPRTGASGAGGAV